jgi:WD40 repeat protein
VITFILVAALIGHRHAVAPAAGEFSNPQSVTIRGYDSDAMEPFITRDGRYLLFNDSNAPGNDTNLQYAERVDDVTFDYRGPIANINSTALDGVATLDTTNTMYFVSTRSYAQTQSTIYRAVFENGDARNVALVDGISKPGVITFDVEVTADGDTLYLSDGVFNGGAVPSAADLAIAQRDSSGAFKRVPASIFANINTSALEYAACLSSDQLELFFTRLDGAQPAIYRSTRSDRNAAWGTPHPVTAITGFVEAPAFSPDGRLLYYHARRGSRFVIERVERSLQ